MGRVRHASVVAALLLAGCGLFRGAGGGLPGPPLVPPPMLRQPATPTAAEEIEVRGRTRPGYSVELSVNGSLVGFTTADLDGEFRFVRVPLAPGRNRIAAVVEDAHGNRSPRQPLGGREPDGTNAVYRPEVVVVRR